MLNLLSTDAEIANLLTIGIPGVDYMLTGNRAELMHLIPAFCMPVNQAIVLPYLYESERKTELMRKKGAEVYFFPRTLRFEGEQIVLEEEAEIDAIFEKAQILWTGEVDNPRDFAIQICNELKEAGWEKIQKEKNNKLYPSTEVEP